ncbi:MAG: FtsX-like permease family protein [Bacteroidota bacterium]
MPRKILVVVQFTVAVTLIIGTIIVDQQVQFAQSRPVGYDRSGLISLDMADPNYVGKTDLLRNEVLATGVVSEVAYTSEPLTEVWRTRSGYDWEGKDPSLDVNFVSSIVTFEFGKAIGWKIIEGRDFSIDHPSDTSQSVILNQSAIKYMGMKDPVGKQFINLDEFGRFKWSRTIVGIVEDIVMESPYDPVKPTIYSHYKDALSMIHIKIAPETSASVAIPKIQEVFKKLVPTASFDYKFVDTEFANKFRQEQQIGKLSSIFSVLAILISSLGLFGLSSFVAEQKTKEIGLRKVMGASVFSIWKMLSKDFVILVVISCCVAAPVAYYFMDNWLQKYPYRTELSYWIFGLVLISALTITLVTISFHAVKAGVANPVDSLRSE